MKAVTANRWEKQVDAIINAHWRNKQQLADSMIGDLHNFVRVQTVVDNDLVNSVCRLIDFCCMERSYVRGAQLCEALSKLTTEQSPAANSNTGLMRLSLMLSEQQESWTNPRMLADDLDEVHFTCLFAKA